MDAIIALMYSAMIDRMRLCANALDAAVAQGNVASTTRLRALSSLSHFAKKARAVYGLVSQNDIESIPDFVLSINSCMHLCMRMTARSFVIARLIATFMRALHAN